MADTDPVVTVQTQSPITAAMIRAVIGGLVIAASAGIAAATLNPQAGVREIGLSAAGAFITYLITRGGAEGWIDNGRAQSATRTELKEAGLVAPPK